MMDLTYPLGTEDDLRDTAKRVEELGRRGRYRYSGDARPSWWAGRARTATRRSGRASPPATPSPAAAPPHRKAGPRRGGGRRVLLGGEVGTKRGGPLPGNVFRPLVRGVIGHWVLPSRPCWRRHARSVRVLDRCARLKGEDRGNGFGVVAGDIGERPHGAVGQLGAEPVGGTGRGVWVRISSLSPSAIGAACSRVTRSGDPSSSGRVDR